MGGGGAFVRGLGVCTTLCWVLTLFCMHVKYNSQRLYDFCIESIFKELKESESNVKVFV